MASIEISALPAVSSASLTDVLPAVQSGTTYKESLLQIQTLFNITPTSTLSLFAIQLTNGATNGYILTSDSMGNGSWQSIPSNVSSITATAPLTANGLSGSSQTGSVTVAISSSGYVSSVTGTTNEISVSPTTGAVVASISSSYVGQTSITTLGTISTGTWHGTLLSPTYGGTGVNNGSLTITLASGSSGYILTSDSSGNATWQAAGSTGVSSITGTANQISASASTGAVTLSLTNGISIGSFQGTSSPTGGLIMPGILGIGTNSPNSSFLATLNISSSILNGILIDGTASLTSASSNNYGIEFLNTIGNTSGAYNNKAYMIGINGTLEALSGSSMANVGGIYINLSTVSTGALSVLAGLYIDSGSSYSSVTAAYGGYFKNPTGGSTATAIYGDNASFGYTGVSPSSGGMVVSGNTSIGSNTATSLFNVGSSNQFQINTSGDVTAGVWEGTVVGLTYGGTNADLTASNGGIFYSTASAGAILSGTATASQVLLSGASTTPSWSTATYPSTVTVNQLLVATSSNVIGQVSNGTTGQVLQANSSGVPSFSTATYPSTTTINQILYSSAANTVGGITAVDNGVLISNSSGVPSFLANASVAGEVLTSQSSGPPVWAVNPVTLIATQNLASPVASVTFSSIPTYFTHLKLVIMCRTSNGTDNSQLNMQIGTVASGLLTAANYSFGYYYALNNSGMTTGDGNAATAAFVAFVVASTNFTTFVELDFPYYSVAAASPAFNMAGQSTFSYVAPSTQVSEGSGGWSYAAVGQINEIKLFLNDSSNFVANSIFYLYGYL